MIEDLDTIRLARDFPEHGLKSGDLGTVVHVYADGKAFEVEVVGLDGRTIAVLTVERDGLRPVRDRELAHVRELA